MSTLHLIRGSALNNNFDHYQSLVSVDDDVILMDDGCYNVNILWLATLSTNRIFVVTEHMQARGLTVPEGVMEITAKQLPKQLFKHTNNITWT
ncbi:DsrH/TusB family sulfur metabolism protein [Thalassotalea sp. PP2-459]|uniref:DsrH/TusB family sulfur metabolism protein n=1 Tax=Thalassotalea sp. PP2-459 TaxID=1742724 RepID=UPI0009434338|nr:DsrH/TusB family sulfur metabolism protein [Thalassotalea sp. PP2-459]OKY24961.1 hypothetical protein BI291_04380 [Thalassotalea sp. PP2-459]